MGRSICPDCKQPKWIEEINPQTGQKIEVGTWPDGNPKYKVRPHDCGFVDAIAGGNQPRQMTGSSNSMLMAEIGKLIESNNNAAETFRKLTNEIMYAVGKVAQFEERLNDLETDRRHILKPIAEIMPILISKIDPQEIPSSEEISKARVKQTSIDKVD